MLESATIGPLYKTILHRPNHELRLDELITKPAKISVSKLNQWVSFFTLLIWLTLLYVISSPFDVDESLSGSKVFIAFVGIISCSMMCCRGKTHLGAHGHKMRTRKSKIL